MLFFKSPTVWRRFRWPRLYQSRIGHHQPSVPEAGTYSNSYWSPDQLHGTWLGRMNTDKKRKWTFQEIQMGAVAKSYMRKGFLIYEEIRKHWTIYEEAVSHIWLCNRSLLNFLIYEEHFISFFISVPAWKGLPQHVLVSLLPGKRTAVLFNSCITNNMKLYAL